MQCKSTTAAGKQCTRHANKGTDHCWHHTPANEKKRQKIAKKAGKTLQSNFRDEMKMANRWPVARDWATWKKFCEAQIGAIKEGECKLANDYQRHALLNMWAKHITKCLEAEDRARGIGVPVEVTITNPASLPVEVKK